MRSCHWPDGTDDHGSDEGGRALFVCCPIVDGM